MNVLVFVRESLISKVFSSRSGSFRASTASRGKWEEVREVGGVAVERSDEMKECSCQ